LKTAWHRGRGPWIQIGPKDPDLALELDRRRQAADTPATSCTTIPTPPSHRTTSTSERPESGLEWAQIRAGSPPRHGHTPLWAGHPAASATE
jgi:hypothetical protein